MEKRRKRSSCRLAESETYQEHEAAALAVAAQELPLLPSRRVSSVPGLLFRCLSSAVNNAPALQWEPADAKLIAAVQSGRN